MKLGVGEVDGLQRDAMHAVSCGAFVAAPDPEPEPQAVAKGVPPTVDDLATFLDNAFAVLQATLERLGVEEVDGLQELEPQEVEELANSWLTSIAALEQHADAGRDQALAAAAHDAAAHEDVLHHTVWRAVLRLRSLLRLPARRGGSSFERGRRFRSNI